MDEYGDKFAEVDHVKSHGKVDHDGQCAVWGQSLDE